MPPKQHGPMSEDTAKCPQAQGPIQYKHLYIQAIEASNQYTSSGSSQLIEVPSGNTGTTVKQDNEDEGHTSAVGSRHHRKQYSKVFKLAALTGIRGLDGYLYCWCN